MLYNSCTGICKFGNKYLPSEHKTQVKFRSHFREKKVRLMGREIRYAVTQKYQLPTEDFARNFGVSSIIQKELLYVQTYFVSTSENGHTDDLQAVNVYINFMIGLPEIILSLHFHLTTTDKIPTWQLCQR
jgi:hypothetical protein